MAALARAATLHYCELVIYYRAIYHRATMILYLVSRWTMATVNRPDSSFQHTRNVGLQRVSPKTTKEIAFRQSACSVSSKEAPNRSKQ
ncbi:hypothetical protein [Gardnerella sp. Marseille-Q2328]|uniref:hypothetical protein n=1 Tax=Gardnerella sp. Marseille-Q2328 TaxID=2759694 RepID=UPI002024DC95|nr:hypothetical protein [Gardnerella sp. Marseille-Q2328]